MLRLLALAAALLALSSAWSAPSRDGLLLELPLAGDLRDTSGNGHDAQASGDLTFAEGRANRAERAAKCLSLSGTDGYVVTNTNLPSLKDTFTVECWVNPAATQRDYCDILGNHAFEGRPNGFVLQQDGNRTNAFYFAYGSATGYVYSKTIPLTPGVWQHVAIVKTPTRLRFYVNGTLCDNREAKAPIATSGTPFMVGNGIFPAPRLSHGLVSEVRVWDRPLSLHSTQPQPEQVAQFIKIAQIETLASAEYRVFRPGNPRTLIFHMDPDLVPDSLTAISLSLECRDHDGRPVPLASPIRLLRSASFGERITLPAAPGYFTVTFRPSIQVAGKSVPLSPGAVTYTVMSETTPSFTGVSRPFAATAAPGTTLLPLDGTWRLATDPTNVGRDQRWFTSPRPEAKEARVPWIIQDAFPGYHGLAWYWRSFSAPRPNSPGDRYLLRFWAADYKADVYLNDTLVGSHEGGETPFVLDVTAAVRPAATNRLAVRLLNPTHTPVDGIVLNQTPHRDKFLPYSAGATFNFGGLTDSVELMVAPAVRVDDVFAQPDPATGNIRVRIRAHNASPAPQRASLEVTVAPAASGETLAAAAGERDLPPGDTALEAQVSVPHPHLWDLNDPFLYRVSARIAVSTGADERSVRCGFRDFHFERGYFRLNGRRIFVRSTHTVNTCPVGIQYAPDPDFVRRDMLNLKAMGFNMVRFIWGGASRAQLDLCDELGLMVYEESYASWPMDDSPKMGERFDNSVADLMLRDRNHPSVVIWGLLNESNDCPAFLHAVNMLPLVRYLDDTRMVMLNSGRYDGHSDIGPICNPGSGRWENTISDQHNYPRVPHTADIIHMLREITGRDKPLFLTEYGIGSGVDLWRTVRHYERIGKENVEDAQFYRTQLDRFLADWERWHMAEAFGRPADFFTASLAKMAGQRTLGLNALRANPNLVGHSLTGGVDQVSCGEGLFTTFREPKPGTVDAMVDAFAPLRLCLFAEPVNVYRGSKVKLEAVLANEDALRPGEYPVRVQVLGPDGYSALDRTITVTIPEGKHGPEPPLALPVFSEDLALSGPSGKYRFVAEFERGAAATGGETEVYVADPKEMPSVGNEVVLWGEDRGLADWLAVHGIRTRPYTPGQPAVRETILVSRKPMAGGADAWRDLAARMAHGATVIFLCPEVFAEGDKPLAWLPLANKGSLQNLVGWLYLKDEWAKQHPIFAGLPAGGLMDYTYYRELIPDLVLTGQDAPSVAIAGANKVSQDYFSGLLLAEYPFGAGRFIINTLNIRGNLGTHPAAERLLRNMLLYAGRDASQPLAPLPPDFATKLREIGYR